MYRCKLCVAPVLQSQGRKQLASLTSASCVAELVDLACESGTAKTESTQTYASGYLCNKCFNSIAKYSGLKEELLYKLSKVHHSSSSASSSSGAGTSEISQGTKRKADAALQEANAVKGFITGLPTAKMFNDSVSSTYSSFGVDSLAENLYASTPPSSSSLSEYSFVGNISPITPEVSCVSSDESDDIPSEPSEYPPQSTPVPAGIGNEGNEEWYGFRLVGDNVDKNVKPRDMRLNSQTTSLHYFHTYAVKDRICFSHLSTDPIEIVQDSINFEMFYPTVGDNTQLVSNLETLVARMFVQRIPGLQSLSAEATPHIKHLYSKQMALKSEVVPLGVMLKNENVLGDMINILDGLHQYIPTTTTSQTLDVCAEGGHTRAVEVKLHNFSYIPLGGDQLTIARIRGILSNSDNGEERLEGFVPVIEDWHTKMCFMEGLEFGHDIAPFLLIDAQVIWKRLYSSCSGMDTGTLFQLRNVINRRNVITDVSKDLTACEEFMQLATIAHVVSAAIHIAGVTNMSELSSKIMSTDKPMAAVKSLVKTLISEMVRIEYIAGTSESACPSIDSVQEYAKETLSLGLTTLRIQRCEGGPGHNIPADLHMEHLNKLLKGTICHLGANKTPQAIIRAGKALGALKYILEEFDRSTGVWVTTNHTTRSEAEDLMKMVTELSQNKVFSHKPGRKHQIFPSIQCNKLLESINQKKLDLWMTQKVGEILKLSPFSH
ncbi:hypothetical protein EMCRGX_G017679 [Ephydatia muelleri]